MAKKMIYRYGKYYKCQIKGDESDVYWLMVEFDDESVVVMDDDGVYYYVRLDRKNGSAV